MTFEDDSELMDGGDDILAAEYVVGVLSTEDRRDVSARIKHDEVFARLIDAWETRLSPLAESYRAVAPPVTVKMTIDRILFSGSSRATTIRGRLWQNLNFWRAFAAVTFALLIVAAIIPTIRERTTGVEIQLVASIAPKGSDVSYLAYYDPRTRQLSLSHLSGERGTGRDFELWAIEGQAKPVSLGVIPTGNTVRVMITPEIGGQLSLGGVLAISLEPPGGSPTGQATGPVVAAGGLHRI